MHCHWVERVLPFRCAGHKDAFAAARAAGRGAGETVELGKSLGDDPVQSRRARTVWVWA